MAVPSEACRIAAVAKRPSDLCRQLAQAERPSDLARDLCRCCRLGINSQRRLTFGCSSAFRGPAPVANPARSLRGATEETPWATTATLRPEAPLDWAQKTSSRTCSLTTWTLATGTAEAAATPPALAPPARTASSRSVSSSRPSQSREERRLGSRMARRLTCRGQSNQLAVHRRRRRSRRKHRSRHPSSRRARTLE